MRPQFSISVAFRALWCRNGKQIGNLRCTLKAPTTIVLCPLQITPTSQLSEQDGQYWLIKRAEEISRIVGDCAVLLKFGFGKWVRCLSTDAAEWLQNGQNPLPVKFQMDNGAKIAPKLIPQPAQRPSLIMVYRCPWEWDSQFPWESQGNGNETLVWEYEWEWEGMGKSVDRNGNNPSWEKFPRIFLLL